MQDKARANVVGADVVDPTSQLLQTAAKLARQCISADSWTSEPRAETLRRRQDVKKRCRIPFGEIDVNIRRVYDVWQTGRVCYAVRPRRS